MRSFISSLTELRHIKNAALQLPSTNIKSMDYQVKLLEPFLVEHCWFQLLKDTLVHNIFNKKQYLGH